MPRKFKLPKNTPSKKSPKKVNMKKLANENMSMTELQFRAAEKGVLFAGLKKGELVKKINNV